MHSQKEECKFTLQRYTSFHLLDWQGSKSSITHCVGEAVGKEAFTLSVGVQSGTTAMESDVIILVKM